MEGSEEDVLDDLYEGSFDGFDGDHNDSFAQFNEVMATIVDDEELEEKRNVVIPKNINLLGAVGLTVGLIIGAGIFTAPGLVFHDAGSIGLTMIAWVLGGLIAMSGGLSYVELGTSIPKSGGEYAYLNEAFGPLPAFLFTWNGYMVKCAALSMILIVFSEYFCRLFYLDKEPPYWMGKLFAFILNTFVVIVNSWNTKYAMFIQKATVVSKIGTLIAISIVGIIFIIIGKGRKENFQNIFHNSTTSVASFNDAMLASMFSYDGWNNANYAIEEMKNPSRDLPLAIGIGIPMVMTLYLLTNIGYIAILPLNYITETETIALRFGLDTFGKFGFIVISIAVSLSALGASNAQFIGASRLLYATARDGIFPRLIGNTFGKNNTPIIANVITFFLSTFFLAIGNFKLLLQITSFSIWIFYFLSVVGLMIMRRTQPNRKRPFRVWLVLPIFFGLFSLFLLTTMLWATPLIALSAVGYLVLGLVYYCVWFRKTITFRSPFTIVKHAYTALRYPSSVAMSSSGFNIDEDVEELLLEEFDDSDEFSDEFNY